MDYIEAKKLSQLLLEAKKNKALSFSDLGNIIDRSEVWVASLFYGQACASEEEAKKLLTALELDVDNYEQLMEYPIKGSTDIVPTDPLIYRFYEIMQVYGLPLKGVINEKFGDGIMSAIDFTLDVNKEENINGDRVVITMSGKFLPYKKW